MRPHNEEGDWPNLLHRLQRVAETQRNNGFVIMKVTLVLMDGNLRMWQTPEVKRFEPKGGGYELLGHLLDETLDTEDDP